MQLRGPSDLGRREQRPEEENQGRSEWQAGISGLWSRLMSLKSKMTKPSEPAGFHTSCTATTLGAPDSALESVRDSRTLEEAEQQQVPFESPGPVNPLRVVQSEPAPRQPVHNENGIKAVAMVDNTNSKKNFLAPSIAKKIATTMAVFGASVVLPVQGLMAQLSDAPDFSEVACAATSALTSAMEDLGYHCTPRGTRLFRLDFK